jgi:hypothetical protein
MGHTLALRMSAVYIDNVYIYILIYVSISISIHIYICYICILYTYICIYLSIDRYMMDRCINRYVDIDIYTHTHTDTHTYTCMSNAYLLACLHAGRHTLEGDIMQAMYAGRHACRSQ